jgi:hypothetical protein
LHQKCKFQFKKQKFLDIYVGFLAPATGPKMRATGAFFAENPPGRIAARGLLARRKPGGGYWGRQGRWGRIQISVGFLWSIGVK